MHVVRSSSLALCFFAGALSQTYQFLDPPVEYRPKFRYWLPDASVSSDDVAKDIHAMRAAGAGGLELLPFYNDGMGLASATEQGIDHVSPLPDWAEYGFGTPAFLSLFKNSLQAAQEAGIVIDYALGANQAQGVPSEVSTAGLATQLLLGSATIAPGGSFSAPVPQARQPSDTLSGGLGFMHPLEQFDTGNLTAVVAYRVLDEPTITNTSGTSIIHLEESSFIDLTLTLGNSSFLEWTPPDATSTWRIFSIWEAYTNQRSCDGGPNPTTFLGNGSWTVDHFSKTGAARVTTFWDQHILSNDEVAGLLRTVGNYAWEDSMEILAALYWTPGLLQRFNDTLGYSLLPYLPLLFNPSNTWTGVLPVYDETYVFDNNAGSAMYDHQLDYRKVLNDGYQDYLSHLRNWSHSIGTQYSAQPAYNLPLQMLSDISLIDAPEAELLGFTQSLDAYRQFTGIAHIFNQSVISTELGAVKVSPYSLTIPDLLQQVKRSLSGGFTMHVIHGFTFSGPYSNTTWPGYTTFGYQFTEMWNRIQPAWLHIKDALDFVGRNQWVLQQGTPKVDLALYLYASPWAPTMQYNSDNLRDLENGKLGGPEYKAIIFSNQTVVTLEAIEVLIDFARNGVPVVFAGPLPDQVYPVTSANQIALKSALTRLLSETYVHQVDSVDQIPSDLGSRDIKPRVALDCSTDPVFSLWRSTDTVDYIYFFNDQAKATERTAEISVSGVTPLALDAWTGLRTPLLQYTANNHTLSVPLAFKSNETFILALERSSQQQCSFISTNGVHQILNQSDSHIQAIVDGPATVTTAAGKSTQFNATLPTPTNLTTWELVIEDWQSASDRYAIKTETANHTFTNTSLIPWAKLGASASSFSGIGHYTTNFTVPESFTNTTSFVGILRLPLIQHTARVYLDSEWLGPIDPVNPIVTIGNLKSGVAHELRVDVSTTLFNRIKFEANETWSWGQVTSVHQPAYLTLPYEDYGLVGSVVLSWGAVVDFAC